MSLTANNADIQPLDKPSSVDMMMEILPTQEELQEIPKVDHDTKNLHSTADNLHAQTILQEHQIPKIEVTLCQEPMESVNEDCVTDDKMDTGEEKLPEENSQEAANHVEDILMVEAKTENVEDAEINCKETRSPEVIVPAVVVSEQNINGEHLIVEEGTQNEENNSFSVFSENADNTVSSEKEAVVSSPSGIVKAVSVELSQDVANSPKLLENVIVVTTETDKTTSLKDATKNPADVTHVETVEKDKVDAAVDVESGAPVSVKMSVPSETCPPTPTPIPPPRRPSSTVFGATMAKKPSSSSFQSAKLFSLPRSGPPSIREESTQKKKKGMFSWLGGDSSKKKTKEVLESVSDGLRKIYKQKLYPLEEFYKFHDFHSPALDDPDFDAKPMILLVGQYSTGKTTFIRYLLEQDFPGIRIGPEPTTDRFIAVMHSEEEGVIPGNALVVDAKKQFRALSGFGNAFLNRFQCSTLPNQVLESITIVDTPGILSGEKQRIDRGYDFTGVLEWFAERVDRIILLFDAHKLDISDEFKRCIEALGGNEDKIRIVLNKSDMVDHQQLMRVYGALMWSLGKVFRTPEVSRVYLGSFWDKPLTHDINRRLFVDEQHDLFQDLQALPRNAALRKLNDLIKRARLAKVHAYIIAELRKQMPSMIGKEKKKKELIQNLDKIFEQIQREHNISPGDFPDIQKMREKLQNQDFTKFNPLKPKLLEVVDGMLATDIARLMAQIPKEEQTANAGSPEQPTVRGGAFAQAQEAETPFGFGRGEGFDKGADEQGWVVSRERTFADSTFESLNPVSGFISGRAAKEHMVKSKLPNAVLGKIWKLADVDQDGQLDADEFALANYLINLKLEGHELPAELPAHLIPPSKREKEAVYPNLDEE